MQYTIQQIIIFCAFLPVFIPAIVGIRHYKQLTPPLSYLFALIFVDLITEIIIHIYWLKSQSNLFIWPFYTAIEFALIAWIYRYELKPMFVSKVIPILIIAFTCFVFFPLTKQGSSLFQPLQRFLESLFVLFFVLLYFYKALKNTTTLKLERQPMFWVSSGLLIYFAGDIFIFIFSNYILSYSKQLNMEVWITHAVLNIVLYIFYTLALYAKTNNKR